MLTGFILGSLGTVLVFAIGRACYLVISRRRMRVITRGRLIDLFG